MVAVASPADCHVQPVRAAIGGGTACIHPGSPCENGFIEAFSASERDELLNGEMFYSLREVQIIIERWRQHYNPAARLARLPATGLMPSCRGLWEHGRLRSLRRLR